MRKAIAACGHLGACADENDRRFTPAVKTIRHGELTLPVFLFQLVDGVEKDHEAVPFFFCPSHPVGLLAGCSAS